MKPQNIVEKEYKTLQYNSKLKAYLPSCLDGYFNSLAQSTSLLTQKEYLGDIRSFLDYIAKVIFVEKEVNTLTKDDLSKLTYKHVNKYFEYCDVHSTHEGIITNTNRTKAKKRSALTSLFKWLYKQGITENYQVDGFDEIKVRAKREIVFLEENEVMELFDVVDEGRGLTRKEREAWKKTRLRDKAILTIFLVCALRISELEQLNVSSFNFKREEFLIYRKRDKTTSMPLNTTVMSAVQDYINLERPKIANDALFISRTGNRLSGRQITNIVKKYTSIVLKTDRQHGYSPHKLRATTATSLIRQGESIFAVRDYLDHEDVSTTQLYAQNKKEIKRELSEKLDYGKKGNL